MSPILLNIFSVCLENKMENLLIKEIEGLRKVTFLWITYKCNKSFKIKQKTAQIPSNSFSNSIVSDALRGKAGLGNSG